MKVFNCVFWVCLVTSLLHRTVFFKGSFLAGFGMCPRSLAAGVILCSLFGRKRFNSMQHVADCCNFTTIDSKLKSRKVAASNNLVHSRA